MVRLLPAVALISACQPTDLKPCMDGYTRAASGACTQEGSPPGDETDPTHADTGTGSDTGTASVTVERGDCTPTESPAEPSIELISRTDTDEGLGPSTLLIELLDGAVEDDRFWAVGQGGLMSFDLSGSAPELDDVYSGMSGRFYRLLLVDHDPPLAYVTHRDAGMMVVDRSDPSDLELIHSTMMSGLGGMAMQGDRLYITRHNGSISVFDASDPETPTLTATVDADGHPWNAVVTEEALYTADNTHGLGVFSLDDPDSPVFEQHVDLGSGVLDLDIEGSTLFVAAGSAGLLTIDIQEPLAPSIRARLNTGSPVVDVSVSGTMAWLVDHEAVWSVDISNPDAPAVIGRMTTPRFAMTVSASGNEAWVGDWTAVGGYRAHPDRARGTIVARPDTLRLSTDRNNASVEVANLGPEDGRIVAWNASESDADADMPSATIPAGGSLDIELNWPDSTENGQLCLQTDDPTNPTLTVNVQRSDSTLSVPLGAAAPDFELTSLDGETVRLSEQLGHPVLLVYFATW